MIDERRKAELDKLSEKLGLTIDNYDFLDTALTHSSYTFENKNSSEENNERLEFLGDAVLKIISSRYLFDRFPEYSEGELTKIRSILVSDAVLSKIAVRVSLQKYLKIGFHEEKLGGRNRPSTLACAFEAVLGAFYLDGKITELYKILTDLLADEVTEIDKSASKYNFKAILQEYAQGHGFDLPDYQLICEQGPPHDKTFEVEVLVNDEPLGVGTGKSKKEAQQKAAQMAANSLGLLVDEDNNRSD